MTYGMPQGLAGQVTHYQASNLLEKLVEAHKDSLEQDTQTGGLMLCPACVLKPMDPGTHPAVATSIMKGRTDIWEDRQARDKLVREAIIGGSDSRGRSPPTEEDNRRAQAQHLG